MTQVIDKSFLINNSKPHSLSIDDKGKQLRIANSKVTFSIVGGSPGLYGDFHNTFEVAVFDNKTNFFITRYYFPEIEDDVVSYLPLDELLKVLNKVFENGFRVP